MKSFGLDGLTNLVMLQGVELIGAHTPPFSQNTPVLIFGLSEINPSQMKTVLSTVYPPEFVTKVMLSDGSVIQLSIKDLSAQNFSSILIPSLGTGTSFTEFQEMIAHLRAPEDGCPWDKEQTHLSLRKHLLEESYETISAMDQEDPVKMAEEFGDLLLQIVLNAQIGCESGTFNMAVILKGIYEKILRRHPHVFGEVKVGGVSEVLSNWEKIKAGERNKNGESHKGILDGLPAALPAMTQAQEFQDRAARVGFDWPVIDDVISKILEDIYDIKNVTNHEELLDEIGDLFFVLVNFARWKKIDSESALRQANLKFKKRFKYIEKQASESGRTVESMDLQEMDDLWNKAKIFFKNNEN
ncbi:MAG: nucleoside triphosphate pyrophosphohydrolase [Chloroflexota bacterium]